MNYKINKIKDGVALVESKEILIKDVNTALDLISTVSYDSECNNIIVYKEIFVENFFDLKNGILGEVFQKFINYGYRLAIIGDFEMYSSKALNDFIFECNSGRSFSFVNCIEYATKKFDNK